MKDMDPFKLFDARMRDGKRVIQISNKISEKTE